MQSRIVRRSALAALLAIGALVIGSAPASAAPEKAPPHAYGVYGKVTLLGPITVGPLSETSWPGTPKQSVVSVPDQGLIQAGVIESAVNKDDQGNSARASVANAKLLSGLPGGLAAPVSVNAIHTSCSATTDGISTDGEITGLKVLGSPVSVGKGEFTVLDLAVTLPVLGKVVIGKLTLNEVVTGHDGSKTVNGLHLTLLGGLPAPLNHLSGELVLAHAHCGPAAPAMPLASGAGLWIGLGVLGLGAVPAGFVAVRRRRVLA